MKSSNSKTKAFAFWGAAFVLLIALLFTACPNNAGGNKPGGSGENPSTPPSGKVIFTLDAGKLNIIVKAKTKDGSDIQVEGCDEATLKSDVGAELHAKGTIVTLKGKISELICHNNQLVALNVQGCTALKDIQCQVNQLNADVFKKLFIDLPVCKSSDDDAEAILYTEETGANEGNHKDFTNPPELKAAFDGAKSKNWTLMKKKPDGTEEDI